MTIKAIAYIIVDLLFVCVLVAAFVRSRREAKANKENSPDGGDE